MLPIAGPVAAASILPPGNTVPIADEPDTAAVAHEAGKMLIAAAAAAKIEHQRIPMKRAACVICKQAAVEGRRGIRRLRRRPFQEITPNVDSKVKDRHIPRSLTGCASCKVSLCAKKGCWEAFHSGVV